MFQKLLAMFGLGPAGPSLGGPEFYKPFAESHVNFLYNLLFCDDLALFKNEQTARGGPLWDTLRADVPDYDAIERIAQNPEAESRVRALAYNRLREAGRPVPTKTLLGVIVELPLEQGLDVLAAYSDGRVRYLNQSGKIGIFECGPPEVEALARELVSTAQPLVNQIGPWEEKRLPPPRAGNVRMTFLVSDGLYFGEGPFHILQQERMGGPVLAKAAQLLQVAVAAGLK